MTDTPTAKRPRWSTFVIWAVAVALLATLGWGLIKRAQGRPSGDSPEFTLNLFEGYEYEGRSQLTLAELEGKVVVINFWAEWCVECKREAAILEATWREYQDQGVVFIGVDWVDVETQARKYLVRYDITYPNGPDLGSRIGQRFGLTGVPETYFIDKQGQVAHYHLGPLTQDALVEQIELLLKNVPEDES